MPRPALLLIAHGSPDPQWRAPLEAVHARARELAPDRQVELCYLERSEPGVAPAVEALYAEGHREIRAVALLLSGGGRHMKKDIPEALSLLEARLPGLKVELVPNPAGARAEVIEALARAALDA